MRALGVDRPRAIMGALLVALSLVAPRAPAGAVEGVRQMLCNPGFEDTDSCWTADGGDYSTARAATGEASVHFCDGPEVRMCSEKFKQEVRVPHFVQEASLGIAVFGSTTDDDEDCSTTAGIWLVDPSMPRDKFRVDSCERMTADTQGDDPAFVFYMESGDALVDWLERREGLDIKVWAVGRVGDRENLVSGDIFVDDAFLSITTPYRYDGRTVSLDLAGHLKATVSMSVESSAVPRGCYSEVPVRVQRRINGSWVTVWSGTSGTESSRVAIPDRQGTYRAVAPAYEFTDGKVCERVVAAKTDVHEH